MYYQQSGTKCFVISFFTSLIVAGAVSFAIWYFSPSFSGIHRKQRVEVPNLKGVDLETARSLLDSKGLSLIVEKEIEDPVMEKGKILFQNPIMGTFLNKGDIVKVVVSKGPPPEEKGEVIVPDLTGLDLNQAKVLLAEKKLIIGNVKKEVSDKPENTVLSSIPEPGKRVPEGFKVDVVVSVGPGETVVPRLYGLSVESARRKLANAGLKLGNVYTTTDPERAFDIIIRQSPRAGSKAKKGSKVDVTVNVEER